LGVFLAEDAGRGCSARELERQQRRGNYRPKAVKKKPRAALGATGVVSGRVPRVLRASQQLYDVFCRRSRAVPLGALLPPQDSSPRRYPEDNGTPSQDRW
ncbi:unnamed protein product, partial [Ascophyllum nodosum]